MINLLMDMMYLKMLVIVSLIAYITSRIIRYKPRLDLIQSRDKYHLFFWFNKYDWLGNCSRTFVGIANKIREVNPDRKYVTHMVNPKGITTLSENYDEVYFTNSYADWDEYMKLPDNVRIIKVI